MSNASDIKARRFVTDPDDMAAILKGVVIEKHAPGKHDQKTHAGGKGGGLQSSIGYKSEDKHPSYDPNTIDGANIEYYTSSGYEEINEYLRKGGKRLSADEKSEIKEYVRSMDKALNKTETPREMVTYRGISGEATEQFVNLKKGETFTDKGFISTTTDEQQMPLSFEGPAVVLEITTPQGNKMLSVPRYFEGVSGAFGPSQDILGEGEHILPRGTTFRVDGFGSIDLRGVTDKVIKVSVINE